MVFYPDLEELHLESYRWNPLSEKRWSIYNMHVLTSKAERAELISAKCEHREPTYDDSKKGCTFINRFDPGGDFREVIDRTKQNMFSRTTNSNVKQKYPIYRDSTVDGAFRDDPCAFGQWYLDHWYPYPTKLELDKDILGFGEANHYGPQYMALVPVYVNNIFVGSNSKLGYSIQRKEAASGDTYYKVSGYNFTFADYKPKDARCGTYAEVLEAVRKMKAEYVRSIIRKERSDGYMPDYILEAMERWAALCELGLIKKWEPSAKTLVEAGVV